MKRERFRETVRLIGAIASKDIKDAIKNKATLSIIVSAFLLILFYQLLPTLETGNIPPRLAIYDAGESRFVEQLENATQFDLVEFSSQKDMERYIANKDFVILGLPLSADFDHIMQAGELVELEGYIAHWVSEPAIAKTRLFFEEQLNMLAERPIQINFDHAVYSYKDSRGMAFLATVGIIITLIMSGLNLTPLLIWEEKQTKTIDALLVSPVNPNHIVAGKAITSLFYCLLSASVALFFNTKLVTHWGVAILTVVCGSLFIAALGLLVGVTVNVKQNLVIWLWVLTVALLLPLFISLERDLLPESIVTVLHLMPTVALSRALRVSFSSPAPLAAFGPELALVIGYTIVILSVVTWQVRQMDR